MASRLAARSCGRPPHRQPAARCSRWAAGLAAAAGALAWARPAAFAPCGARAHLSGVRRGAQGAAQLRATSPWALDTPSEEKSPWALDTPDEEAKAAEAVGGQAAQEFEGAGEEEEPAEVEEARVPVAELEVGQELQGTVHGRWKQLGVFVDVGAEANGLLRVVEMTDRFPGDRILMKKGDNVTVRVLDKNEDGRFSLTMLPGVLPRPARPSAEANDPSALLTFLSTEWFDAEVDHMTTWGAFVRVWPGGEKAPVVGLLHKSRFRAGFAEEISIGSKIRVRAVSADSIRGRIDLSMLDP